MDTTRRLLGSPLWTGGGYARAHYTRVVDPDIVRRLEVGQAAYIYRGGVTYLQVKRLTAGPAELPARVRPPARPQLPAAPAGPPPPRPPAAPTPPRPPAPPPDAGPLLDEVFGRPR